AGQVDRCEGVYRQVLELAPDDPSIALPAARALERFYLTSGKHRELAEMLRAQVRLEEQGDVRRELRGRLGRLAEESLSDDAAAIDAWKERLEDDPADDEALAALDRLYERAADHRNLVEVLRTRERNADDIGKRKELMERAARTLETLGDVEEA